MKLKALITVMVLGGLFAVVSEVHACPPPNETPEAVLTVEPQQSDIGTEVTLDGSGSFDPDGSITKYEWDFDGNNTYDYNENPGDGIATHVYLNIGLYTAKLRVTDNVGETGTDTCKVFVGRIFNVNQDTAYSTIQAAIIQAAPGQTIRVYPGTYYETIDFKGNACTVTSSDPNDPYVVAATVIAGSDSDASVVTFAASEGSGSVLTGFTITGGGRGIYCSGASPTIKNCVIKRNYFSGNGGGMHNSGSSPEVTNCFFVENVSVNGAGIYNRESSSPAINSCIFAGNSATIKGGGISNHSSGGVTVTNCTFSGNSAKTGGGMANYSSSPAVTNCIFWQDTADSNSEIHDDPCSSPTITYCDVKGGYADPCGTNFDSEPNFIDVNDPAGLDGMFGTRDDGLRIMAYSPCVDAADGNAAPSSDITGLGRIDVPYATNNADSCEPNYADVGAYESPTVWFVDVNVADSNDGSSWEEAFDDLQDALSTADGNYGDEIWVAEGTYKPTDTTDPSISFVLREGVGVYGGFIGIETACNQRDWGNNQTVLSGDINVPGDANDNSFHVVVGADDAVLDGFVITGGNANGTDANSCGGGVFNNGSTPTVTNCAFCGNQALKGGGMYNSFWSAKVTNCVFTENDANYGGGLYDCNSSTQVTNSTITGNRASDYGGGIYGYGGSSSPIVTNCIFWANTASSAGDQMVFKGQLDSINYCCIQEDSGSQEGMVSHWKFDEGSGTTAYDSVDGNNDGTIYDATWTTGKIDGALEFDKSGDGDWVDCGNDDSINALSTFSISLWFKTDVVPGSGAHPRLIVQGDLSAGVWAFFLHGDYSGRLTGRIETSGTPAVGRSNFIPETGQWYHAAMTYDDNGDRTVRVYVDGEEQSYMYQSAGTGDMSANTSIKVAIGNRIGGGKGWDGVIDDVRVYNRALSDEEVGQFALIYFGEGNIEDDPCFVDVNDADGNDGLFGTFDDGLCLQLESLCIDAGDGYTAPPTDILGFPHFDMPQVDNNGIGEPNYSDIGAYESYSGYEFDTDGDDLWDYEEYLLGTNLNSPDSDSDGLSDGNEANIYHTNPLSGDTDSDGLADDDELSTHNTSPLLYDSDGDGIKDGVEIYYGGFDPTDPCDADDDLDGDGLSNLKEYLAGTEPDNNDTDGDGMGDKWEYDHNDVMDPLDATDLYDDLDKDGYANILECQFNTDPNNVSAKPDVILVPDDYNNIQAAVDAAGDGNTVIVKPGTYIDDAQSGYTVDISANDITLRSINPLDPEIVAATIIKTQYPADTTCIRLNGSNSTLITGFTIRDGYYGVHSNNSSGKVTHCVISGNNYDGIYVFKNVTEDITFEIDHCVFAENEASGVKIHNSNAESAHDVTIKNCFFVNNRATNGGGVNCASSTLKLENCVFSGNRATSNGGALFSDRACDVSPSVDANNCTFTSNTADKGGAIYRGKSSPPGGDNYFRAYNCILWGNSASEAHEIFSESGVSSNAVFNYCDIDHSADSNNGKVQENNCIDKEPLFVYPYSPAGPDGLYGTDDDGLQLQPSSPCVDAADGNAAPSTDITGRGRIDLPYADHNGIGIPNYVDIGAYEVSPIVWHVKEAAAGTADGSSWDNATYLQDALAQAAQYGGEIRVAEGTYKPDCNQSEPNGAGNRASTFELIDGVALYGGFSGSETIRALRDRMLYETILSGDINEPNDANSYHVVSSIGNKPTAVIDGFTIEGGDANGSQGTDSYGGGIYGWLASPTIRNCTFKDNKAITGGGAGLLYEGPRFSAVFENCTFSDNEADNGAGMAICYGSSPTVASCIVTENTADNGGAVYIDGGCSPSFEKCLFSWNASVDDGGGMYNKGGSPILTNSVFSDNEAERGGGMCNFAPAGSGPVPPVSAPRLTNCIFVGNTATSTGGADGGAMYNENCRPTLINCTLTANTATTTGGIYNASLLSDSNATNCILWADTGSYAEVGGPGQMTFSYCDIQGCGGSNWDSSFGINGGGNIEVNPYFMDASDPAGPDGLYGTQDDGLQLSVFYMPLRSCIDSADYAAAPEADITGRTRKDVAYIPNKGDGVIEFTDMGAYESAPVWYVDEAKYGARGQGWSWKLALDNVQGAIDRAQPGDEIWVAVGTYRPGDRRSDTFHLNKAISVYGGFSGDDYSRNNRDWKVNETILSGAIGDVIVDPCDPNGYLDATPADNCYHVVKIDSDDVVLDGFTVMGGYADDSNGGTVCTANLNGGGVYIDHVSPYITNCLIRENYAEDIYQDGSYVCGGLGSGIFVDGGSPTIANCIFYGNGQNSEGGEGHGGAVSNRDASPKITNCIFTRNSAKRGGAVYNTNSSTQITNCIFRDNEASGESFNSAGGAIKDANNSFLTATNCIFNANKAWLGSGIYNEDSSLLLTNCTFTYNENASIQQGALQGDYMRVKNCIFWDNKPDYNEIRITSTSIGFIGFSDIEGGAAGISGDYVDEGNIINNNPIFVGEPEFYDLTTEDGWDNAIKVADAGKYSVGDVIQYATDENALTVTHVDYLDNVVAFEPALNASSASSVEIKNWGRYAIIGHNAGDSFNDPFKIKGTVARLEPNSTPSAGSPCIDAGLDEDVPWDTLDLDSDGRTDEKIPYDILKVRRLQDIPGYGDSRSVDIGAFECGGLIAGDIDDPHVSVTEDVNSEFTLNIEDLKDGEWVTYEVVTEPQHGTWCYSTTNDVNVIYMPHQDYNGADELYYKAYDGINYSEIAHVTIMIAAVDDAPNAVDDLAWINEDTDQVIIDVLANDWDPDPYDKADINSSSITQQGSYGTATVYHNETADQNEVKYAVNDVNAFKAAGYDTFIYEAFDNTEPDPCTDTATVTVKLNHYPVALDDPNDPNVIETEPNIIKIIDALVNDYDPDGHSLTIAEVSSPNEGKAVVYTHAERGDVLLYEPDSQAGPGSYTFTYKVKDQFNLSSVGAATVTVTVKDTSDINDLDQDKIANLDEGFFGTDSGKPDSDADGYSDGEEVIGSADPTNRYSTPFKYAEPLPYIACFQMNQGYVPGQTLHNQRGWKVADGNDHPENCIISSRLLKTFVSKPAFYGRVAKIKAGGNTISREFDDKGAADHFSDIVRVKLYPAEDANVLIYSGETAIAGVNFADFSSVTEKGKIYYWDPCETPPKWVNSDEPWEKYVYGTYNENNYAMVVKFQFDFGAHNCKIYWDAQDDNWPLLTEPQDQVKVHNVPSSVDSISKIEFTSGPDEDFGVRSVYINSTETITRCNISNPSDGDDVEQSRIPVKGYAYSVNMSGYGLDWFSRDYGSTKRFYEGSKLVNEPAEGEEDDVLGYWDTGLLANDLYHVAVLIYEDMFIDWLDGIEPVFWGDWGCPKKNYHYFAVFNVGVTGSVKSTTFHHVAEPDISVPWPGEFPFELRRIYDSKRHFVKYPFFPGWTNNNQIILTEDASYYESSSDPDPNMAAKGNPADEDGASAEGEDDSSGLGFGVIYVQYEDGSTHLFRHMTGSIDGNEAIYTPYRDDGSGDYVKRVTTGTVPYVIMNDVSHMPVLDANKQRQLSENTLKVHYELYRRDGTAIVFHDINEPDVVAVPNDINYPVYPPGGGAPNYVPYKPTGGAVYEDVDGYYYPANPPEPNWTWYAPGNKWRFVTAVKTKSDRFGNTLHFKWNGDRYYPDVNVITYDPGGNGSEISIELKKAYWSDYDYAYAELKVDGEVQRTVHYNKAWTYGSKELLEVCVEDKQQNKKDYTSYMYWYDDGFLYGIFNDKLVSEGVGLHSPPWSAIKTEVHYDSGGGLRARFDFVDVDGDDYKYIFRNYWHFFVEGEPDDGIDGQCVWTSTDYYSSDYLMLPYRMDLRSINEKGQIRDSMSFVWDSLAKIRNLRYSDYRLPFTPTRINEIWHDYDVNSDKIIDVGKIILNDYNDKTFSYDPTEPNNPDVNCFDFMEQRVYEMGYDGNELDEETIDANKLIGYGHNQYHDYNYYGLDTNSLSYQTLNATGPSQHQNPVATLCEYGLHDGNTGSDAENVYLIEEKVRIAETGDSNLDWAVTSYEYNHRTCYGPDGSPNTTDDAYALTRKTDPCGAVTLYGYDDNHYKQWVKVGPSGSEVPTERYYHDALGQMRLKADTYGLVTLYDYDGFGDVTKIRSYHDPNAVDPQNSFTPADYNSLTARSTTVYTYDQQRRRISEKTYSEEKGEGQVGVKRTEYTKPSNLPTRVIFDEDADPCTTSDNSYVAYTLDGRGLKIQEQKYDAVTSKSPTTDYWYDSMDRLIETRWYKYGGTSPLKRVASVYHGSGKKAYEITFGENWKASGVENRVDYQYDRLDRLTDTIVSSSVDASMLPVEWSTTSYDYDDAGNRTCIIAPDNNCIFFDYDNANRQIAEYFAEPFDTNLPNTKSKAKLKTETRYYANNLVMDVNAYDYGGTPSTHGTLLARVEFGYDKRDRITDVNEAITQSGGSVTDKATTTYDYEDANDSSLSIDGKKYANLTITDPCDNVTEIAYNELGKMFETEYPSLDYQRLNYNGDGTLKARSVFAHDANSEDDPCWIEYYHDAFARLTDVNYPDGGNIHYSLDGFGRITQVTDNRNAEDQIRGTGSDANQISYKYDPLDRITDVNDQDGYDIQYTYRGDGQKLSVKVFKPGPTKVYDVQYQYDTAGRVKAVNEPPLPDGNDSIAQFEYNKNGNRSKLTYLLEGDPDGNSIYIDYTYNEDNLLSGYSTNSVGVTGPTFTLNGVTVDGLGRLTDANETITKTDQTTLDHGYTYVYDMRSQLTDANITNIGGTWAADYAYHKSGNMSSRTINLAQETFGYTGHLMTDANDHNLSYDENGNLTSPWVGIFTYYWNWDNKLRRVEEGSSTLRCAFRYDPAGNRIWKKYDPSGSGPVGYYTRKYIVDVVGDLPVILLEMDPCNSMSIEKTYIYANSQILAQHDGDTSASRYFYLHDRLGSVRELIDTDANVVRMYTYEPFGDTLEEEGTLGNPFMFTGQWFDSEIDEYYLRARMYNSYLGRFTARDPVQGKFEEPLTLHKYLYCGSDPANKMDPKGLWLVDRWWGHPQLTIVSMRAMGFMDDVELSAVLIGSIMTDYREDHYDAIKAGLRGLGHEGNIPHYEPGYEELAEAHAEGALELALWWEHRGLHDLAMMTLGEGLHTIQDRWAHFEQGAHLADHFRSDVEDFPNPDNPGLHTREYLAALEASKSYISRFKEASAQGIWDLDESGTIGYFNTSPIKWHKVWSALDSIADQGAIGFW